MKLVRHIGETRHAVIDQIRIEQLAIGVVHHLLKQRVTNSHHRRAFFLADAAFGMNCLSDIGDRDQSLDSYFARLFVDIQLHHSHPDFPENRQLVIRDGGVRITVTDQFAAGAFAKTPLQSFLERQARLAANQRALLQPDLPLRDAERVRGNLDQLLLEISHCRLNRIPHTSGRAAGTRRAIVRRHLGVRAHDANLIQRYGELFARDLRQDRPHPLSHFRAAGENVHHAVRLKPSHGD